MSAFFAPFLPWPLSTAVSLILSPPTAPNAPPPSKRYAEEPVLTSLIGHITIIVSAAWKILIVAAVYHFSRHDPADAASLAPGWIASVTVRDVAITWLVGGVWDWLHLSPTSPAFKRLQPLKFSGAPARLAQVAHDAGWATSSALVSTAWEIILCHCAARGWFAFASLPGDRWWTHPRTMLLLLALPHLQIVHFYLVHRFMHKWFPRRRAARGPNDGWLLDVGAWLYKHVHSVHHRSRDPTALSGISMHPIESALFFTTMPLMAIAGVHPIAMLHAKFYNIVVAMLGHESYGDPSTGGHFHWLHHQLVECNFGGPFVPMDWIFGTAVRDEDEFAARFFHDDAKEG